MHWTQTRMDNLFCHNSKSNSSETVKLTVKFYCISVGETYFVCCVFFTHGALHQKLDENTQHLF